MVFCTFEQNSSNSRIWKKKIETRKLPARVGRIKFKGIAFVSFQFVAVRLEGIRIRKTRNLRAFYLLPNHFATPASSRWVHLENYAVANYPVRYLRIRWNSIIVRDNPLIYVFAPGVSFSLKIEVSSLYVRFLFFFFFSTWLSQTIDRNERPLPRSYFVFTRFIKSRSFYGNT